MLNNSNGITEVPQGGRKGEGEGGRREGEEKKPQKHNESSKPGRDVGEKPARQN